MKAILKIYIFLKHTHQINKKTNKKTKHQLSEYDTHKYVVDICVLNICTYLL